MQQQDHLTPSAHPPVDVTSWRQADHHIERLQAGRDARRRCPLSAHAGWRPRPARREAIALLEEQSAVRVPELIPLRYQRMSVNAFTFYRGTVLIMTNDLASTPVTGIPVQCVGDAHIGNFGMFRSPSARLVFDINDFDETTTGPWEWDIKRLAVSVMICAQALGFDGDEARAATLRCVRSYREHIQRYAGMDYLDAWYDHIDVAESLERYASTRGGKENRTLHEAAEKAARKDNDAAAAKLTYYDGRKLRFKSKPPELVPLSELQDFYYDLEALQARIDTLFEHYRHSLYEDRRHVLDLYRYQDTARKVVGVGSVGQRAWVTILAGRDHEDPLMIQMKEATHSVLEHYCGPSRYVMHGERVVQGQKLIQSTADVLLGWASFIGEDGRTRDYYVRQLWNGKGSINLEKLNFTGLSDLSRLCARCLAHAHARTGDVAAIAGYLGDDDAFDRALADFAEAYAEQNQHDYEVFMNLIDAGVLPCMG